MPKYLLPDLEYDYSAIEPAISGKIMELHHDKHHRAYVDGANQAMEQLLEERRSGDFAKIAALERALAFNLSGHVLHSIFWRNLSPDRGGVPKGTLGSAIERDFGSLARLKEQMNKAAANTMGSGWAALVWEPLTRRLGTTLIHDHQSQVTQAGVPLLVIDAWEHAYYLQYQTDKAKYFAALWNVWNWDDVQKRFESAQRLDLGLPGTVDEEASAVHQAAPATR
jgi:Fe-Mn family superoxide dismutase